MKVVSSKIDVQMLVLAERIDGCTQLGQRLVEGLKDPERQREEEVCTASGRSWN